MERMKRVKLIYDWLAFIVDVFVGYRPEAHLPQRTAPPTSIVFQLLLLSLCLWIIEQPERASQLYFNYCWIVKERRNQLSCCLFELLSWKPITHSCGVWWIYESTKQAAINQQTTSIDSIKRENIILMKFNSMNAMSWIEWIKIIITVS